jgi:phosphatidylglycerophosphate synthase
MSGRETAIARGGKDRDYWWTVLAVDPLAIPAVRFLGDRKWVTPDQVTWLSMLCALPIGLAFSLGRAGLAAGAILFYVSFFLDCVDGKLARATAISSPKGKLLDDLADGARRASGSVGLAVYLWRFPAFNGSFWLGVAYGILAFYFAQVSGTIRDDPDAQPRGRWSVAMARRRLYPTPGTPDAAALVFFFGPLTGLIVPCLLAGIAMFAAAILLVVVRVIRR